MNVDYLNKLLAIGQLSLELRAAEHAATAAKSTYHAAFRSFECGGEPEEYEPDTNRIARGDARWDEVMAHTKPEFDAYQAARGEVQKIKRRWQSACKAAVKHQIAA